MAPNLVNPKNETYLTYLPNMLSFYELCANNTKQCFLDCLMLYRHCSAGPSFKQVLFNIQFF